MRAKRLISVAAGLAVILAMAAGVNASETADPEKPAEEDSETEEAAAPEETADEDAAAETAETEVLTVTRGDFLEALYALSGAAAEASQDAFTDVPNEGGYAEAIHWALDNKIVNGYGGGLFGPDDPVTREQAAAMIYRYAQSLDKGFSGMWMFLLDAPDAADISGYADEAMHWIVMNEIFADAENGVKPQAALKDYELVPLLSRLPKALGMDKVWYAFADTGLAAAFDSDMTAAELAEVFETKYIGLGSSVYVNFGVSRTLDVTDMDSLKAFVEKSTLEDTEIVDRGSGVRYAKAVAQDGTLMLFAVGSDGNVYYFLAGDNEGENPAAAKAAIEDIEASVCHFLDVPAGAPKIVVTAKWSTPDYKVLVNKQNELPADWEAHLDLVSTTNSLGDPVDVERNAYRAYLSMKDALEAEGVKVDLDSAYRSVSEQQRIMDDFTETYGADYAAKTVAKPGFSEHQTGLALDLCLNIDGEDVYCNEDMIKYPEVWAKIHAKLADYGFILRYPEGMEHVTGYGYEPWHIRYVGSAELAHEIEASGKTLEGFLGAAVDTVVVPELGESALYTAEELTEAAVQVKCRFAFWKGCELHSLRYAGDECNSEENLKWANEINPDAGYTQVAEFITDFHSPVEAYGAWEEDREYTDYQWWLGRTDDCGWDLFSWGY